MIYQEMLLDETLGARLDCYLLDPVIATGRAKTRPVVVLLPGGAYLTQAHCEGEPVAARLLGLGFDVCILRYSTHITNAEMAGKEEPRFDEKSHYPLQVLQAMQAVACVREHAKEWDVDPQRVTVMGFSAGGHIAGSFAERFDDEGLLTRVGLSAADVRPDELVLCYPMITGNLVKDAMGADPGLWGPIHARALFGKDDPTAEDFDRVDLRKHVRPDMPRTFVWQTAEDSTVSPLETLELVVALRRAGVPCELHLFERGHHGLALADVTTAADDRNVNDEAAAWVELFVRWHALANAEASLSHATM